MDRLFPSFLVYQELNSMSIETIPLEDGFSPGQRLRLNILRMFSDELNNVLINQFQFAIQKNAVG